MNPEHYAERVTSDGLQILPSISQFQETIFDNTLRNGRPNGTFILKQPASDPDVVLAESLESMRRRAAIRKTGFATIWITAALDAASAVHLPTNE